MNKNLFKFFMNKNSSKSAAFLSDPSVSVCVCWAASPVLSSLTSLMPLLLIPPRPPVHLLLFFTPSWISCLKPNKQTNRTTEKPITQTRLVWAWGRDGGEILFAYWASSISLWWRRRPPRTRLYPHFCLTSGAGNQVSPQSTLAHHLLTQYAAGWSHRPVAFT